MLESLTMVRRALVVALLALAVGGVAACGDENDGDVAQTTSAESTSVETGSDRGETPKPSADNDRQAAGGSAKGGTSGADQRGGATAPAPDRGNEEQRVAGIVKGMYDDLAAGNARGVCAAMSTAAREQIAQQVPGGSTDAPEDRTCEASLSKFLDVAARNGIRQAALGASVQDVAIDGSRATVALSLNGSVGKIELLRESGAWRFGVGAVAPGANAR